MTTGRINQVAAEIYFETERGANTERLGVSKFISSRLGWRFFENASSHEFRTCRLYHAPRRRLRPEKFYILVLDAAAGGLCCTSFLFGFSQRGPSAHRPTCGGLCEDPELSVRTVWFDMNRLEGLKQTPSIHTTPAGCVKPTYVDSLVRGDRAPGG